MKNENKIFDPKFTEMIRIPANDIRVVEILYNVKIKQDLILNPKVHLNCFKNFLRIIELTSTGHLEKWVTSKNTTSGNWSFGKYVILAMSRFEKCVTSKTMLSKMSHFGNRSLEKSDRFRSDRFREVTLSRGLLARWPNWQNNQFKRWSILKWPHFKANSF